MPTSPTGGNFLLPFCRAFFVPKNSGLRSCRLSDSWSERNPNDNPLPFSAFPQFAWLYKNKLEEKKDEKL